ncbi:hypothetical protein DFH08DRAFT_1088021 [Mycena albidolilacea]|uniref:F-box domain-containing protein n=1 Tax=Mycena albidolilacea TaxID=1033008 RepID=A0AAD6Z7C4_9AGAR|nr:hypothetical protein DFH08DRAFT_1088021 [Mycena albidolilacea]
MNSARTLWSSILRFSCKRDSEVLKDLERDRSLAQRQLNAVTDPVARLPLELSSKIFIHSLPLLPVPAAINAPLLLLNICSAWRNIALSTPALWDAIHISAWTEGSKELVPSWLECAGERPLSISFNGIGTEIDYDVLSVIWERGEQLKNLDIFDYQDGIQLWKGAGPGPLPKLETLHIVGGAEDARGLPSPHISELLCLAPNLVECLFEHLPLSFSVPASQRIILPNLRRLMFGGDGALPGSANEVLNSLSLPALEVLVADVRCDILLSFLKRSSPPLQELVFVAFDFLWLDGCFQLVPDLRQLKIWMAECHVVEALFVALAECPSLLPRLSSLDLHFNAWQPLFPGSFWTAALRALTTRRTQFQLVHFNLPDRLLPSKILPPDTVAAFKELAADGTKICISDSRGESDRKWKRAFE